MRTIAILTPLCALALGCGPAPDVMEPDLQAESSAAQSQQLTRKDIPAQDPGPPFYARVTSIQDQFFHDDAWLAIPFYRPPACVPPEFNLLQLFDFPGPNGPGAFECPILLEGFLLTETDAPPGRFPKQVILKGSDSPIWFVPWQDFQEAMADGIVTVQELETLDPLIGTTRRYHETLRPREGDHLIVIKADGTLADGRSFSFHVTHQEDRTRALQIRFRD